MKTTIIKDAGAGVKNDTYPALYRDNEGRIALATSATQGIIIHEPGAVLGPGLAWMYHSAGDIKWSNMPHWSRITTPVTIEFHP